MINSQFSKNNKKGSVFLMFGLMIAIVTAFAVVSVNALTDTTQPTVLSVSPANGELDVKANSPITILFSEDMNPSTINTNTITVSQSTDPKFKGERVIGIIDEKISYADRTATFIPNYRLIIDEIKSTDAPSSQNEQYDNLYDNVFTVTITTGAKDLAGNSLLQNYVWRFTEVSESVTASTQQNQNLAPVSLPAAIPIQSNFPVADSENTAASAFPWIWVIGGLFLLALLILLFSMKPAKEKSMKTEHTPNPFGSGDKHPIIDLEGIGPEYNKQLHAIGIMNTEQLWKADAANIARKTNAPLNSVKSWQHMAELASIKDIGPQYAELLERSGVHSISQLKNYKPNKLLKLVREKQDSLKIKIQGNFPGHAMAEHWINEARDHKFSVA